MQNNLNEIVERLKSLANSKNVDGMAKFGINPEGTLGISMPNLRSIAKEIRNNNDLAIELWDTGIHEARILATLVADPKVISEERIDKWVEDIDSWDVCDQFCSNLLDKTEFCYKKIYEWTAREDEFVKRAGFALIATSSMHHKKQDDKVFEDFLALIINASNDERNFVKKAVNWALRQIGKRSNYLNEKALIAAYQIKDNVNSNKAAKWIASDAIKELESEKIRSRINK